jgi:hypothetical protein
MYLLKSVHTILEGLLSAQQEKYHMAEADKIIYFLILNQIKLRSDVSGNKKEEIGTTLLQAHISL